MAKRQRLRSIAICSALLALASVSSASADVAADDTPPQPASAQTQPASQDPQAQAPTPSIDATREQETGTSNDRLLFAMPNFLTIANGSEVPPLSSGQKFKAVARSAFDYFEFPWYAALAGINQAENSEPGYRQGFEGYAKRYGAAFADGTIENFWTSAILPSGLHQDPRFYQKADGGFGSRSIYAASRMFVTRSDAGHREFNASEIFGAMIAAVISTYSYHPKADKTVANTASVWGSEVGYDTITIEIKEFWPDIHRKLSHKAGSKPPVTSAP